jgi:hypothetical protein
MRYEFRMANGQICCSGDVLKHLCKECQEKARSLPPGHAASGVVPPTPVASFPRADGAPPPPDLAASIRARRATPLTIAERRERVREHFSVHHPVTQVRP